MVTEGDSSHHHWIRYKTKCLSTSDLRCLPICRLIFFLSVFPLDVHNLELLSLPISYCVASSLNSCHTPPKVGFAAFKQWIPKYRIWHGSWTKLWAMLQQLTLLQCQFLWKNGLSTCRQIPRITHSWHSIIELLGLEKTSKTIQPNHRSITTHTHQTMSLIYPFLGHLQGNSWLYFPSSTECHQICTYYPHSVFHYILNSCTKRQCRRRFSPRAAQGWLVLSLEVK